MTPQYGQRQTLSALSTVASPMHAPQQAPALSRIPRAQPPRYRVLDPISILSASASSRPHLSPCMTLYRNTQLTSSRDADAKAPACTLPWPMSRTRSPRARHAHTPGQGFNLRGTVDASRWAVSMLFLERADSAWTSRTPGRAEDVPVARIRTTRPLVVLVELGERRRRHKAPSRRLEAYTEYPGLACGRADPVSHLFCSPRPHELTCHMRETSGISAQLSCLAKNDGSRLMPLYSPDTKSQIRRGARSTQ